MNHKLFTASLSTFSLAALALSSDADVTFRTAARVVSVDVMVQDTKTGQPFADLSREDFRLRIDGKDRTISHFAREGGARRPLAILLHLNLAPDGALRELSQPPALPSFEAALARLAPEDEVAVHTSTDWFVGEPQRITDLTQDRRAAAQGIQTAIEAAVTASGTKKNPERAGREGNMAAVIAAATALARARPSSRVAVVHVSDGMNTLDTMEIRDRRKLAAQLLEADISFSALDVHMMGNYATAAAILNPIGLAFGLSVTGSGRSLAKQTGGITVEAIDPAGLGPALSKVLSMYSTRYSLGYQVKAGEYADGRMHRIEVRLAPNHAKHLRIHARQGFFSPPDGQ